MIGGKIPFFFFMKGKVSGQIYMDYLGLIGFVIVTQYFISCDFSLKLNRTKYKIVFLYSFRNSFWVEKLAHTKWVEMVQRELINSHEI